MRPLALMLLTVAACGTKPHPASQSKTVGSFLPHFGETADSVNTRFRAFHLLRPDGTEVAHHFGIDIAGDSVDMHASYARWRDGVYRVASVAISHGKSAEPLRYDVKAAFLAALLPPDARRISPVSNGPEVAKDADVGEGQTATFYESTKMAKSMPHYHLGENQVWLKGHCATVRPGILYLATDSTEGQPPNSIELFSEYAASCLGEGAETR